jgi:glycerol-3-phosphate dehydrogenase
MNREEMLASLGRRQGPWDIAIIGGGATGMGIAVDAAARGYSVALLEQGDFGVGTSSRSTKLVHGGVRYLQQGNLSLVREGLRERSILRRNAPHLVTSLSLVIPAYQWWERPWYGAGLKLYDLLASASDFGPSRLLSRTQTLAMLPTLQPSGLRGGILYHDGQFDDARLLIQLAMTAAERGATLLNYAPVVGLSTNASGTVDGVLARDVESGRELEVPARVVINATGAFADAVRRMAAPGADAMVAPSQGTHVVLSRDFLPGSAAIMVPRTRDGRVMFAIPWRGHTLVGTTDTPIPVPLVEPLPLAQEIDFLLETIGHYLGRAPSRADVLSVFAGIRPLLGGEQGRGTAQLSRDYTIRIDGSGLVTTAGGKWTTYRRMAEDTIDRVASLGRLPAKPSVTASLQIHGFDPGAERHGTLRLYGADAPAIAALSASDPSLGERFHQDLSFTGAEVIWAVRHEMARTVEDVLARRGRALFLNARLAVDMAPRVAMMMAAELGHGDSWARSQVTAFTRLAQSYLEAGSPPGRS